MTENSPLGDLLRGSVDVSSCQIGEQSLHFLFAQALTLPQDMISSHFFFTATAHAFVIFFYVIVIFIGLFCFEMPRLDL